MNKWVKKIIYIPLIDELCYFIKKRASKFEEKKIRKNATIHHSVIIGEHTLCDKNVFIGEGSYFGKYCQFYAGQHSKVVIGKYCAIGSNVHIKARTHDQSQFTPTTHGQNKRIEKDIVIEDNVWIGDNVFIREGITIGTNSIIGANSVVTKNVDAFTVYAGVPAIKIKSLSNS